MDNLNNSAKIYTGSSGGELRISLNNTKKTISATNNPRYTKNNTKPII